MIIIEIAAIEEVRLSKMRLPRIRTQSNNCFERGIRESKAGRGVIKTKKIKVIMRCRELAISEEKMGIAPNSLIKQRNAFPQLLINLSVERNSRDECLRADVKTVGNQILGWPFLD